MREAEAVLGIFQPRLALCTIRLAAWGLLLG